MSNFNEMFTGTTPVKNERTKEDIDAFVAESKENRQKCYQMADEMALKIADDPAYFKQYLDMQGTFPRYSVNNVLLLAEQMPAATKVGELRYWREQNVYIKNQEFNKPLLILEPGDEYRREDGSVGTYYNAKKSMIFHRLRMDVIKNLVRCMISIRYVWHWQAIHQHSSNHYQQSKCLKAMQSCMILTVIKSICEMN